MNKLILSFVMVLLFCCSLSAQKQREQYVIVQTVDGSNFVGTLVEEEEKFVTIEILTGDIISIPRFLINKYSGDQKHLLFADSKYHRTKGYFWGLDLGFNAANFAGDDNNFSSQFSVWFGHRFNKDIALSGGFGFEFNSSLVSGFRIDTQFSSFFAQGKYYLTDGKKRLFTYGRIGYGAAAEDVDTGIMEHSSGANFMYGLGVNFASKRKGRFILSLGAYHQKTSGTEFFIDLFGNEVRTDFDLWINRLILKFGVELN